MPVSLDILRSPVREVSKLGCPALGARSLDPSAAWIMVSIAEAARMSAESMQIVARSKAICGRYRPVEPRDVK